MDKRIFAGAALAALAACSAPTDNDPIYQALRADPPTVVPPELIQQVKVRQVACEIFNEGDKLKQYMICWYGGGSPIVGATPSYYGPNPVRPPQPENFDFPSGKSLGSGFVRF